MNMANAQPRYYKDSDAQIAKTNDNTSSEQKRLHNSK